MEKSRTTLVARKKAVKFIQAAGMVRICAGSDVAMDSLHCHGSSTTYCELNRKILWKVLVLYGHVYPMYSNSNHQGPSNGIAFPGEARKDTRSSEDASQDRLRRIRPVET